MAIMRQGILGGLKNKIGSVVGTSWKGIAVLKSLPLSVANPRTTPQVNQRTKFKGVVEFASRINSEIIKPLWDRFAQRKSGNNAFVSANIDNFNVAGSLDTPQFLKISEGKMTSTPIATAIADDSSNTTVLTWATALIDNFQATTDRAYAMVYDTSEDKIYTSTNLVARSAGTLTINMPVNIADNYECWLAFKRVDGTVVSGTGYLQATVQA
jgi:hypothetical protein